MRIDGNLEQTYDRLWMEREVSYTTESAGWGLEIKVEGKILCSYGSFLSDMTTKLSIRLCSLGALKPTVCTAIIPQQLQNMEKGVRI